MKEENAYVMLAPNVSVGATSQNETIIETGENAAVSFKKERERAVKEWILEKKFEGYSWQSMYDYITDKGGKMPTCEEM